jgi:hypothetical protein
MRISDDERKGEEEVEEGARSKTREQVNASFYST